LIISEIFYSSIKLSILAKVTFRDRDAFLVI
jgi:hypothetical protein